jgi:hypothetical protein
MRIHYCDARCRQTPPNISTILRPDEHKPSARKRLRFIVFALSSLHSNDGDRLKTLIQLPPVDAHETMNICLPNEPEVFRLWFRTQYQRRRTIPDQPDLVTRLGRIRAHADKVCLGFEESSTSYFRPDCMYEINRLQCIVGFVIQRLQFGAVKELEERSLYILVGRNQALFLDQLFSTHD